MTATVTSIGVAAVDNAAAALPPIDLSELIAKGELLTRVDRKYVVPAAIAAALVANLRNEASALTIEGHRSFEYSSLYYDTPKLDCYRQSATRRRRRVKVRHRQYVATGAAYLEVKYAGRRGSTVKERRPDYLAEDAALDVLDRHADFLAAALTRSGAGVPARFLVPTLTTRYRRTTLFLPASGSRVTLDTALTWERPKGESVRLDGRVVVETKSADGPSRADRLLWAGGHRPDCISKYCTGLALLAPDLPANRWHPVLTTFSDLNSRTAS